MTITGDILYKSEPVTLTQNQIPNTPADTLIPGNNNGQTLGIFTANGDIQLANSQSNGNLEIDGSLATICATGAGGCTGNGGLVNTGSAINTLTIVGGAAFRTKSRTSIQLPAPYFLTGATPKADFRRRGFLPQRWDWEA